MQLFFCGLPSWGLQQEARSAPCLRGSLRGIIPTALYISETIPDNPKMAAAERDGTAASVYRVTGTVSTRFLCECLWAVLKGPGNSYRNLRKMRFNLVIGLRPCSHDSEGEREPTVEDTLAALPLSQLRLRAQVRCARAGQRLRQRNVSRLCSRI